jgi:hypothetical protein
MGLFMYTGLSFSFSSCLGERPAPEPDQGSFVGKGAFWNGVHEAALLLKQDHALVFFKAL